jgi:hypothetical protein
MKNAPSPASSAVAFTGGAGLRASAALTAQASSQVTAMLGPSDSAAMHSWHGGQLLGPAFAVNPRSRNPAHEARTSLRP